MRIFLEETSVLGTPVEKGMSQARGRTVSSSSKRSGRTPFQPHNHQISPLSPMQAFRRSLKDATNSRDENINHDTKKPSSVFSSKLVKPKSTSRTTSSLVKSKTFVTAGKSQNLGPSSSMRLSTRAVSSTTQRSTMTSPSRRSLRGTLSPPSDSTSLILPKMSEASDMFCTRHASSMPEVESVDKQRQRPQVSFKPSTRLGKERSLLGARTNFNPSGMGPPQRLLPRTPNSLLRTELNTSDEEDESMLVSPPGALWNVLTTSTTNLVVVSPSAAAFLSPQAPSPSKKGKNQSVSRPGKSPSLQPRAILTSPGPSKWASTDKQHALEVEESLFSLVQQPDMSPVALPTQENLNDSLEVESHREKVTRGSETLLTRHPSPTVQSTLLNSSPQEMNPGIEALPRAAQPQHFPLTNPRSIADSLNTEPLYQTDAARQKMASRSFMGADFAEALSGSELTSSEVSQRQGGNGSDTKLNNHLALSESTLPENGVWMDLSDNFPVKKNKPRHGEKELSPPEDPSHRRGKSGVAMDLSNLFTGPTTVLPKRQPYLLSSRSNDRQANLGRSFASSSVAKSVKQGSRRVSKPSQALEPSSVATPQQPDNEIAAHSDVPDVEAKVAIPSLSKKARAATPSSQKKLHHVDSWAEKQSETFVRWLNYTFKPTEDMEHEDNPGFDSFSPTRSAGLRALLVHRRMAQPRMKASVLFRSEGMSKIRQIVFNEIVKGSLSLRSDRDLYADLGLREQIISLLLSYATPWLQLGLEVIFGEIILPARTDSHLVSTSTANVGSRTSVSQIMVVLQTFITNRVLSDATVLAKYTKGKCKVPSGKFEKQYRSEMRDLVLYRLMVLIFYLDRAKENNILDKEPRLFTKSSSVKSSGDVLLALCRGFLSSEGNFIKHLSRIGLTVSYKQDLLDELEFSVSNLAVDLRDGVRLTRMAEIVTDALPKSLMATLRLPAVSRLQKLHNVGTAISSLRDFGVEIPEDVHTHHIVDGHREMVLKLMWSVIVHCCLWRLLAQHQVEQEIRNVLRSNQARRRVQGTTSRVKAVFDFSEPTQVETLSPEQVLKSQLLRWCQAVCSCFDHQLLDFTTSFADGKAFCYLVHYYHPSLISLEEILPTTRDECHRLAVEVLLANERKNSAMACRRVCELGGIPKMIPSTDVNNPPNEECTLLCLAYLCSRLTESSKEILATILIQACYRKYKKREAARKIWKAWNRNKDAYYLAQSRRYANAVWKVEEFILTHKNALARLKRKRLMNERRVSSAISIQCVYRGRLGRLRASTMREEWHASSIILGSWRRFLARKRYSALLAERYSASLIQRVWRGVNSRRHIYLMDLAAIQLQRIARGYFSKRQLSQEHCAAIVIQNAWWGLVTHWKREESAIILQCLWRRLSARTESAVGMLRRDAAIELQRVWRGCYRRLLFEIYIQSVILIQKVLRSHRVRQELPLRRYRIAATTIQSKWRGFSAQIQYQLDLLDIVSIQNFVRRKIAIRHYQSKICAIGTLQRAFRSASARHLMRTRLEQQESEKQRNFAAATIQSALWRWNSRRELFHRQRTFSCAIRIQRFWRRARELKAYTRVIKATTSMQAAFRGVSVRRKTGFHAEVASMIQHAWQVHKWNLLKKASATEIQRIWRGSLSSRSYKGLIQAAVRVQSKWRRTAALNDVGRKHVAATSLQTEWRRYWEQCNYRLDILEIIIVQSAVRRRQAVDEAARRRTAILIVQQAVRRYQTKAKCFRRRASGILLQAVFRRQLAVKLAAAMRDSIRVIQVAVRHRLAIQKSSRNLRAVVSLQCIFRQRQVKAVASRRRKACLLIQTHMRRVLAQSIASTRRRSIVLIQASTRKRVAIQTASERMRALLVLQCAARRDLARCTASRFRAAVQLLQSIASKRRVAVLTIQAAIRRRLKFKKSTTRLLATVVIQGAMRRALATLQFKNLKEIKLRSEVVLKAAIVCQCAFRSHLARSSSRRKMRALVLVQTLWRVRVSLSRYKKFRTALTILQAAFREHMTWREHSCRQGASAKIQRSWRRFAAFVRFRLIVNDVTTIQSIVRRYCARRLKQERNQAMRTLQQACRRFIAVQVLLQLRVDREQEIISHLSATLLQSCCRGFLVRRILFKFHRCATSVQTAFRRHCTRMDYRMKLVDIVIVQRVTRRWLAGREEKLIVQAAMMVQSTVRKWLSSSRFQTILSAKKSHDLTVRACTRIQCLWRGEVARNLARRHSAARAIQKTWRSFDVHVDFILKVMDVITIQSFIRGFIARTSFKKSRLATVLVQALVRRKAQSNKIAKMMRAAVIIQSAMRVSFAELEFQRCRQASVAIQRYTRGFLVRDERAIANFAALYIQRVWRGHRKLEDYTLMLLSVRKIQSILRVSIAKRLFRNLKLAMWSERVFRFRKAVCLQRAFRQYTLRLKYLRAARTIQRICRGFLVQIRRRRFTNGVHRLQAVARARLLRRRLSPNVVHVAHRVSRANARAKGDPKMLLGFRTFEALTVLQTSTRLSELMAAVATLETSTRLSFVCCVVFTDSQAANSLLALIRTCNRSLPHMELLQYILLTLNNVSRHPALLPSFANPESAEIFLDLSQIFRDKDGIFCLSVSLLGCVFGFDSGVKQSLCSSRENLKRLKGVHGLCSRKVRSATHKNAALPNRIWRRDVFDVRLALNILQDIIFCSEKEGHC